MALVNVNLNAPMRSRFTTTIYGTRPTQLALPKTALTYGTGANQADLEYAATHTATSGGHSLDLSGSMLQQDGTAFVAAKIVGLLIYNRSTTATLTVGGGSNPIANVAMTIGPLGTGFLFAPGTAAYPVTAVTADILKVVSSEATSTYDIHLIGRSA